MEDVETVVCNICDSSEYEEKFYPVRSGFLVRCRKCGLYYVNPRRSDIIRKIEENDTPDTLYESYKLNYEGRMLQFKKYLAMINSVRNPPGRLVDVGCYEGYFLAEAKNQGWNVLGVEPNIGGAKYAREQLGIDVRQSTLEKAALEGNSFDVVTFLATLEHLPDPLTVLKEAKRIIKNDGILVVSVPTIPFYLKLLRSKWRMFIGDHYYFFNDDSMSNMLKKSGFAIIDKLYETKSVDLDIISARLSEDWQPYNLGRAGIAIRKIVMGSGIGKVRFSVNLFDSKVYFAEATSPR